MESLLDAADALVASGDEPVRPDFDIPEEYAVGTTIHRHLELRESPNRGKGWFATHQIPAGTRLILAKPISMVMEWEECSGDAMEEDEPDEEEDEEKEGDWEEEEEEREPRLNELLLLQILDKLKTQPSLWNEVFSTLFPRNEVDLSHLPTWVCADDTIFMQVEASIQELAEIPQLKDRAKEIARRLPLIIRYNILSVETCPEMLSYPGVGGHSSLSGVGLYHLPSFFNHSVRPNCSRWAVGDVMGIVTNQDIPNGDELCISYIEHDVLCESVFRRNGMLSMDFDDGDQNDIAPATSFEEEEGPEFPVVDPEVQNELMEMDPFERLSAIEELMQQAVGAKLPDDSVGGQAGDGMDATGATWFQCDVHNLRILKAITLDALGQTQKALELWEESVTFTETMLPPADESSVVMRVQAALCALYTGNDVRAKVHASVALQTHNVLFGGGVARFRRRFDRDLQLPLRPSKSGMESPANVLWPLPL
jgi:hypothetical protein